jgi:nitrate/nitrite transporter NarK
VGWHGVFGLAILPVVVTLALFCVFAKEQPQQPAHRHPANYLKVLRENDTWWFSLFYMVTFGGFVGLASFLSSGLLNLNPAAFYTSSQGSETQMANLGLQINAQAGSGEAV